VYIFII